VTYGTPTWIWSVTIGEHLCVRAYYGQSSRWDQAAVREMAGRITSAGMMKEVTFEPVDGAVKRPHRRRLPREVPQQPYLGSNQRTRALGLEQEDQPPHGLRPDPAFGGGGRRATAPWANDAPSRRCCVRNKGGSSSFETNSASFQIAENEIGQEILEPFWALAPPL
jgi:Uncharacterized protein conserved in bacteria (DUF2255)